MKGSFRQFVSQNAKLKTWSLLILFVSLLCIGGIFTAKQIKSLKDLQQSLTEELQRVQKTRENYLQEIGIVKRQKRAAASLDDIDVRFNGTGIKQVYIRNRKRGKGGAVYIRWGRTNCTSGAESLYEGIVGGGWFDNSGSAANTLCLPRNPKWNNYQDGFQSSGRIYGAEYAITANSFLTKNVVQLENANVPCAVCLSHARKSSLMIPGRNECLPGMHLEYQGYLMAGHHGHASASEFICVDEAPESTEAGFRDENGKILYVVEAVCGSLPCPEYVEGRELTCAVCTL